MPSHPPPSAPSELGLPVYGQQVPERLWGHLALAMALASVLCSCRFLNSPWQKVGVLVAGLRPVWAAGCCSDEKAGQFHQAAGLSPGTKGSSWASRSVSPMERGHLRGAGWQAGPSSSGNLSGQSWGLVDTGGR